ncbi:MAG: hypothetical protein HN350_21705 [Phycisphaerales bacterium]|jgi:hypothetical protein|nr:hypothetical protein [Phycisphaerales bacterium]
MLKMPLGGGKTGSTTLIEENPQLDENYAKDAASFERWKWLCLAVMSLSAAAMVWGVYGTYGWLTREFSRMSIWRAVAICLSEAVAFFWFMHFLIARCLFQKKRRADKPVMGSYRLVFIWFAASTLLGWAFDLGTTIEYLISARNDYANARPAEATVTSVEAFQTTTLITDYDISAHYVDDRGTTHPIRVRLRDRSRDPKIFEDSKGPRMSRESVHLVPELHKHLQAGDTPFPMPIRYDPNRPRRYWVDLGYWGVPHAQLIQMSFVMGLILLGPVAIVIALALRSGLRFKEKVLPWWCEFFGFTPLMLEALILFAMAVISRQL